MEGAVPTGVVIKQKQTKVLFFPDKANVGHRTVLKAHIAEDTQPLVQNYGNRGSYFLKLSV